MRTPCFNLEFNWPSPSAEISLGESVVHVWAVALNADPEQVSVLETLLCVEEKTRAEKFRLPHLRMRYIVSHAVLRQVLGRYLTKPPAELQFTHGVRGKPVLAAPEEELHFNLAHSDVMALIAVTRIGPIGVDVERVRPMRDAEEIAGRFFSPREAAEFRSVPTEERDAAFFNLWTRKEAWLKATGDGITESLARFEVTFLPQDEPRVRAINGDIGAATAWSMSALAPAKEFVGAIALKGLKPRLECWRLPA